MTGQDWDPEEVFYVVKYHLEEIELCFTTDGTEVNMPGCDTWY